MQVKKEEVRTRLLEAATEEFFENGYRQSSMRTIADRAGVTAGNIYSYFASKELLFQSVILPAWVELKGLFQRNIAPAGIITEMSVRQIAQAVSNVFIPYEKQFSILINSSEGSKFQDCKQQVVELILEKLSGELQSPDRQPYAGELILALASALVEGFIVIFHACKDQPDRLRKMIETFLVFVLKQPDQPEKKVMA